MSDKGRASNRTPLTRLLAVNDAQRIAECACRAALKATGFILLRSNVRGPDTEPLVRLEFSSSDGARNVLWLSRAGVVYSVESPSLGSLWEKEMTT